MWQQDQLSQRPSQQDTWTLVSTRRFRKEGKSRANQGRVYHQQQGQEWLWGTSGVGTVDRVVMREAWSTMRWWQCARGHFGAIKR